MIHPGEFFRSVELVWIIWFSTVVLLGGTMFIALRRLKYRDLWSLVHGEHGASYTLSYVMCLPFFVLLICALVECSLLLTCKVGTVYAAYAGARSAAVWQSAIPNQLDQKTRLAAVHAMVPFASGSETHSPATAAPLAGYSSYRQAYERWSTRSLNDDYLRRKYAYASSATSLDRELASTFNGDTRIVVTYQMPFHTPGVGRLFGTQSPWNPGVYTIPIRSEAIVQNDAPRAPSYQLGIRYESR